MNFVSKVSGSGVRDPLYHVFSFLPVLWKKETEVTTFVIFFGSIVCVSLKLSITDYQSLMTFCKQSWVSESRNHYRY